MPLPHVWDPNHAAIWREYAPGTTRVITLRHPTYPYDGPNLGTIPNDQSSTLINFAAMYLRRISSQLGLNAALGVPDIFAASTSEFLAAVRLVWLPVHATAGAPAPYLSSFWVNRYRSPQTHTGRVDRTAVIMAVQSFSANDASQVLGSRLGIRIMMHVSPSTSALPLKAEITGASCSIGLPAALALDISAASSFLHGFFGGSDATRLAVKSLVRDVAGFGPDHAIWFDGLRVIGSSNARGVVDVYMTVVPPPDEPEAPAQAVASRMLVGAGLDPEVVTVEKWPLVAHAGPVLSKMFVVDPASKAGPTELVDARPNRSPQRLLKYLDTRTLAGVAYGSLFDVVLHDALDQVAVKRSKVVDKEADETQDLTVSPLCVTHPRLNWFAALNGYAHTRGVQPTAGPAITGLLDTLRAYDLSPIEYFRFAGFPLRVRYRAPIDHGGKDGRVVNAQVNFEGPDGDVIATKDTAPPHPLQIKFALADVKRTGSRRQALGISADPRWCWHEYGHVLLAASTGALQFRFAHSAGDALAAILLDPDSELASHREMRGLTFPWAYIHRRHDRDVFRGWSWSGQYHRPYRFTTDVNSYPRKGYQSEQILSTSLFRLYRALGGETTGPDPDAKRVARRRAADYTAYLIMKAIKLMPPALLGPLETPDQLVSVLIEADTSTLPPSSPPPPGTPDPLRGRVGGWAHKVIRWAFEAQGLYATADPFAVVDAPGLPPDPDVFIDDLRPHSEGSFKRGGYMPVSLDWEPVPNPPNPANPPLWHATADAIRVVGSSVTVVEVSARGPSSASQVTVQVWWNDWPTANPDPPLWNDGTWKLLGTSMPQTVAPGTPTPFGPFPVPGSGVTPLPTSPPNRRLVIVATATCSADPVNTDPATALPCSTLPLPVVDLVAGDNNIGLRIHVV